MNLYHKLLSLLCYDNVFIKKWKNMIISNTNTEKLTCTANLITFYDNFL